MHVVPKEDERECREREEKRDVLGALLDEESHGRTEGDQYEDERLQGTDRREHTVRVLLKVGR